MKTSTTETTHTAWDSEGRPYTILYRQTVAEAGPPGGLMSPALSYGYTTPAGERVEPRGEHFVIHRVGEEILVTLDL